MPKIENNEPQPSLSFDLIKNSKQEIAKFGFSTEQYFKFLESVGAMRGDVVLKYPNEEIDEYRKKFVKGKQDSINDPLMFDKISKIKNKDDAGHGRESGYFCPRIFWDLILKSKI